MIAPLRRHTGIAAVLDIDNVDTDQIIPSREMKTVSRDGLSHGLFAGWRYKSPGSRIEVPGFVLNRIQSPKASILVSGTNFGCGSSREHAVWALREYGFHVIVAKSFGEIFHGNCLRNGILPIALDSDEIDLLVEKGPRLEMTADLEIRQLSCRQLPGWQACFDIGEYPRRLLLEGLDPIGLTLKEVEKIDTFLAADREARPWVYTAS